MHKLYCYVDESGQDTVAQPGQIRIFIIAVAVFETNRAELEQACEAYEVKSGKGKRKWNHCNPESRRNYIRMVVDDRRFQGGLCYFQSDPPRQPEFDACTITGIAKAIQWKQHDLNYTSEIYVDGISGAKQAEYARELRRIGVHVHRVHRARDESYALIRLADALAGLVRAAIAGKDQEAAELLRKATRKGVITEV